MRDVFVITPVESKFHGKGLGLLLAVAYGLMNENAKWKILSISLLMNIGFQQLLSIPQLSIIEMEKELVCILAKIVDDILKLDQPLLLKW